MQETLTKYLRTFRKLKRANGVAPHKPVLLISVIQSYQSMQITDKRIYITGELVALFKSVWAALVTGNFDCRITYPFYHLKSEGFWTLKPKESLVDLHQMGSLVKSFASLNAAVEYAEIPDELFELMNNHEDSQILLHFLLQEYFPETQSNFSTATYDATKLMKELEQEIVCEPPAEYVATIKQLLFENDQEAIFQRTSAFTREITKVYGNQCCISGMRINTPYNISMIDACHIIPFCESYDNTVSNGIALCPNLHRAYDRGIITITPDYKVQVSECFNEVDSYSIKQFCGQKISLPNSMDYWPGRENLEWHGGRVFKG